MDNPCIYNKAFQCPRGNVLEGQACMCEEFEAVEDNVAKDIRNMRKIGLGAAATTIVKMMENGQDVSHIITDFRKNYGSIEDFANQFTDDLDSVLAMI